MRLADSAHSPAGEGDNDDDGSSPIIHILGIGCVRHALLCALTFAVTTACNAAVFALTFPWCLCLCLMSDEGKSSVLFGIGALVNTLLLGAFFHSEGGGGELPGGFSPQAFASFLVTWGVAFALLNVLWGVARRSNMRFGTTNIASSHSHSGGGQRTSIVLATGVGSTAMVAVGEVGGGEVVVAWPAHVMLEMQLLRVLRVSDCEAFFDGGARPDFSWVYTLVACIPAILVGVAVEYLQLLRATQVLHCEDAGGAAAAACAFRDGAGRCCRVAAAALHPPTFVSVTLGNSLAIFGFVHFVTAEVLGHRHREQQQQQQQQEEGAGRLRGDGMLSSQAKAPGSSRSSGGGGGGDVEMCGAPQPQPQPEHPTTTNPAFEAGVKGTE